MKRLSRPSPNGFSLLEMMVVLFIIGLLAGAVLLNMPGQPSALRREGESFAAKVLAARDEAIITGSPVALTANDAGYYFESRKDGRWQAYERGPFAVAYWDEGTIAAPKIATSRIAASRIAASSNAATAQMARRERLVFDSVGLASNSFAIQLQRGNQSLVVSISRIGEARIDD